MNEQLPQQSWTPMYQNMQVNTFNDAMSHAQDSEKDSSIVSPHCDLDVQNYIFSGVNIDSSDLLPPTTVPGYTTTLDETGASTMQLEEFGFLDFDDPWE